MVSAKIGLMMVFMYNSTSNILFRDCRWHCQNPSRLWGVLRKHDLDGVVMRTILLLILSLFLAACSASPRQVSVSVLSSSTGQSVAGADVEVIRRSGGLYQFRRPDRGPEVQRLTTSQAGRVMLVMTPGERYTMEAAAVGYRNQILRLFPWSPDENGTCFQIILEAGEYEKIGAGAIPD